MHELGITRSVVAICTEHARGATVFCFDICAKGTPLEGAVLDIIEVPGGALCRDCGATVALAALYGRCGCGSANLKLVAGEELKVKEMEVA